MGTLTKNDNVKKRKKQKQKNKWIKFTQHIFWILDK